MCRKLFLLLCFVLAMGLATETVVAGLDDDPNLMLHWKLNAVSGPNVLDASGNDYDGEVITEKGGPVPDNVWCPGGGYDGNSCFVSRWTEHNDGNQIDLSIAKSTALFGEIDKYITISVWLNAQLWPDPTWPGLFQARATDPEKCPMRVLTPTPETPTSHVHWMAGTVGGADELWANHPYPAGTVDQWCHYAFVKDCDANEMRVYYNGNVLSPKNTNATQSMAGITDFVLNGNENNNGEGYFRGKIDDFRIYNRVLTDQEIEELAILPTIKAYQPDPGIAATKILDADRAITLSWKPGEGATAHDVYFGTDFDDVNTATRGVPKGVLLSQGQTDTNYPVTTKLDVGTDYYWRIDEVRGDSSIVDGDVWDFSTEEYLLVDDFEYEDVNMSEPNLRGVWDADLLVDPNDPNSLHLEEWSVHTGKAMRFDYNNITSPYYSKVWRDYASNQDWTGSGVKALSFWFRGDPNVDEMYVELYDGSSTGVKVFSDAIVKERNWYEYNIDLSSDFSGLTLSTIRRLKFGIGKQMPVAGHQGSVIFDDIRLYPPRPVGTHPDYDFNMDGVVDFKDLAYISGGWLENGLFPFP